MTDQPNRMLEFLTNPLRPEGEASRGNRRLRCRSKVQVSWPTPDGWRTIPARLHDISRAGAGLLTTTQPPLTTRARIRLTEGEGTPWIEAEVIGVDVERYKRVRVRLRFAEPCPSFVLRLAVLGPIEAAADDEATAATPAQPARPGASPWMPWIEPEADSAFANEADRLAS